MPLCGAVQGGAQRRQLRLGNILQLINDQDQRNVRLGCRGAQHVEERDEIEFEVSAVGDSRLCGRVDAQLDIAIPDLERGCESDQDSHCAFRQVANPTPSSHGQKDATQLGGEHCRQRAPLVRLDHQGCKTCPLHVPMDALEHDGLPYPAQPQQQHAPGRQAAARALHRNANGLQQLVSTRELRGRDARPGRKRIVQRIHEMFIPDFVDLCKINKIANFRIIPE